ncbi:cation:proton antiporter domain-containing protein [Aeoliella mucimassa]|uniref:Inner membrane protein YbaL n=1 Tax=Aeoliella mucimassa TaxID=2527972 RepID=A0A518AJ24_9BACT|nr:cation:proton antiporter [Aeoliella mucimassa]QDU54732.1 Inner membrane protein YbaL [Aeoliella mucimassa]
MNNYLVNDLMIILTSGLIASLVCRWLRISVLVGYLVVGAVIGEGLLGWVSDDRHEIEYIAEAGVFLLLFSIGLEFSLEELGRLGRNLAIGGSVQMLLVGGPVAGCLLVMGFAWQAALLIAAAVSFSSTVLVFKALAEWGHASLPHGRRAIGILLFQDAALIPLLLLVPLLTQSGESVGAARYLVLALSSVLFVAGVVVLRIVLRRWVVPLFASYRSPDLIVLFTLVLLGGVTLGAHQLGLPPAIGSFAAGLVLGGSRWARQIDALVLPFRESYSAVFFVGLGLLFDPQVLMDSPLLSLGCFVALLVIKALAATLALRLTGLRWSAAFGMGIGLAHVGEFAFVLILLGWESGVLVESDYQRIVAVAIGSLILTPPLLKFGFRWTHDLPEEGEQPTHDLPKQSGNQAIVIGAGLIGRQVTSLLEIAGKDVCLVDFSPINLHPFAQQGIRTVAGDATQPSILQRAGIAEASIAVLSVPDDQAAISIVQQLRKTNPNCYVVVRCRYQANVARLSKVGADEIVSEESVASNEMLQMLAKFDAASHDAKAGL